MCLFINGVSQTHDSHGGKKVSCFDVKGYTEDQSIKKQAPMAANSWSSVQSLDGLRNYNPYSREFVNQYKDWLGEGEPLQPREVTNQ